MNIDTKQNYISGLTVLLPDEINSFLNDMLFTLSTQHRNHVEYGIFLKCNIDLERQEITVSSKREDIYVPSQQVTATSISFTEDKPSEDFNMIIHRHPNGAEAFSMTDKEYINQMFDVSLIFIPPNKYPDAVVNIKIDEDTFIQLRPAVKIVRNMEDTLHDLIKEKVKSPVASRQRQAVSKRVSTLKLKHNNTSLLGSSNGLKLDDDDDLSFDDFDMLHDDLGISDLFTDKDFGK